MNDDSIVLRDVALAIETGYLDPVILQQKWISYLRGELADLPPIERMAEDPPVTPVEVTPDGRWEYTNGGGPDEAA